MNCSLTTENKTLTEDNDSLDPLRIGQGMGQRYTCAIPLSIGQVITD